MSLFEKLAHMIGSRKVPIPAMPGIRVPGISFGSKSTLQIIFFTVFVAAAAVGTGMYFTVLSDGNKTVVQKMLLLK